MGLDYAEQLEHKQKTVNKLLKPFGRVDDIIGMKKPYHYRNKVHAVVGGDKKGNIYAGTYEAGTHRLVPVDECLIDNEKADAIIRTVVSLMKSFKYQPYNEDTGRGFLRHILIRTGTKPDGSTGEIMVTLVVAENVFPSKNNFIKALLKEHPEITTVVMNLNNRRTSMVLGDKEQILYGKGYIEDTLCGKVFKLSSKSFYQVNHEQTEVLYHTAIDFAGLTGKEHVLDAYSGIGTIGIVASDHAASVTGVELNKDAVKDALVNVKKNNVKNATYIQGDAGEYMQKEAAKGHHYDVVFMDPPRAGSDMKFLNSLIKSAPEKIVYISCNPETLARDLKVLTRKGYRMVKCRPVEMFAWSEHVETVCILSKLREAKHHVSVTLDMDEMDLTSAEGKATYEEIKKYVAEHNDGMKVSSLNIAQVKRKCGIEVGENFNLPKSGDSRQPQCTKEKEEAIMEALNAFKMI